METKRGTPNTSEAVLVGTRVSPEVKEKFALAARANSRSTSGELRVLIERYVEAHEQEAAA